MEYIAKICRYCGQVVPDEKEIRNKAIDEFAERLKEEYEPCKETDGEIYEVVCRRIDKIAEQMKGGVE